MTTFNTAVMNFILLVFSTLFVAGEAAKNFRLSNFVNCTSFEKEIFTMDTCGVKGSKLNMSLTFYRPADNIKVSAKSHQNHLII